MTTAGDADSFGPYAFALAPAEAEAAAARFGLRVALRGGLPRAISRRWRPSR